MRRRFYQSCLLLHFVLVITVSLRDTFSVLAKDFLSFPNSLEKHWREAERAASGLLGQSLPESNPLRQGLTTYLYSAGIEGGYGFFAPGVPNSFKLVFELQYDDGRIQYELPHAKRGAVGLRLVTLLDYIGRTNYDSLRELMLKMLAYSVWQEHPEATTVRTVFGFVREPSVTEAANGKKESYQFLYAYDFAFPTTPTVSPVP